MMRRRTPRLRYSASVRNGENNSERLVRIRANPASVPSERRESFAAGILRLLEPGPNPEPDCKPCLVVDRTRSHGEQRALSLALASGFGTVDKSPGPLLADLVSSGGEAARLARIAAVWGRNTAPDDKCIEIRQAETTESGVAVRRPHRGRRQSDRRIYPEDHNGRGWRQDPW